MSTKKPCPGCGETAYRNVGEVCCICKSKLDDADKFIKEWHNRTHGTEAYHIPSPGWYPGFYIQDGGSHSSERLSLALGQVLNKFSERSFEYEHADVFHILPIGSHSGHDRWNCVRLTKEQAEAWNELDSAVRDTLYKYFQTGVEYGTNLLKRLANGELSTKDFDSKKEG